MGCAESSENSTSRRKDRNNNNNGDESDSDEGARRRHLRRRSSSKLKKRISSKKLKKKTSSSVMSPLVTTGNGKADEEGERAGSEEGENHTSSMRAATSSNPLELQPTSQRAYESPATTPPPSPVIDEDTRTGSLASSFSHRRGGSLPPLAPSNLSSSAVMAATSTSRTPQYTPTATSSSAAPEATPSSCITVKPLEQTGEFMCSRCGCTAPLSSAVQIDMDHPTRSPRQGSCLSPESSPTTGLSSSTARKNSGGSVGRGGGLRTISTLVCQDCFLGSVESDVTSSSSQDAFVHASSVQQQQQHILASSKQQQPRLHSPQDHSNSESGSRRARQHYESAGSGHITDEGNSMSVGGITGAAQQQQQHTGKGTPFHVAATGGSNKNRKRKVSNSHVSRRRCKICGVFAYHSNLISSTGHHSRRSSIDHRRSSSSPTTAHGTACTGSPTTTPQEPVLSPLMHIESSEEESLTSQKRRPRQRQTCSQQSLESEDDEERRRSSEKSSSAMKDETWYACNRCKDLFLCHKCYDTLIAAMKAKRDGHHHHHRTHNTGTPQSQQSLTQSQTRRGALAGLLYSSPTTPSGSKRRNSAGSPFRPSKNAARASESPTFTLTQSLPQQPQQHPDKDRDEAGGAAVGVQLDGGVAELPSGPTTGFSQQRRYTHPIQELPMPLVLSGGVHHLHNCDTSAGTSSNTSSGGGGGHCRHHGGDSSAGGATGGASDVASNDSGCASVLGDAHDSSHILYQIFSTPSDSTISSN